MIYRTLKEFKKNIPKDGRLMSIDIGTKRIGVAICDKSRYIASPRTTIMRKGNSYDFLRISEIIQENDIVGVLIGLPINMDESENFMSRFARRFIISLDKFLIDVKMCLYDERLSSFIAKDDLMMAIKGKKDKKKTIIDQMAASVILQAALRELS